MTALVQMVTIDRVGSETVPVEVDIVATDPPRTTAKSIIAAASKKFKSVTKQSRAYHGLRGVELTGDVDLDCLCSAFVVLSGKHGWKGSARLIAAEEDEQVPAVPHTEEGLAADGYPSPSSWSGCKANHTWDGTFRGRIGIDVGGVLNQHCNDMSSSKEWWLTRSSEAPNALCSLKRLVEIFGPECVFIVSKLSSEMQKHTETWLHETMDFCGQAGLLKENVHFCRKRSGKDGKGPVASRLRLSYFIDDNVECLESVFNDAAGNSREHVEHLGGKLILFARSGLGNEQPETPKMPKGMNRYFAAAANWREALELIDLPLSNKADENVNEGAGVAGPDELREAARMERTQGVVLVWKDTQDNGHLSNWAKSKITINGTSYCCVEQWIMANKALACRNERVREEIMATSNPRQQKALGRSLDKKTVARCWRVGQKWITQLQGVRAKFQQNPSLAVKLLRTGQKPIAEASPSDLIYGIGLAPSDPLAQDVANWKGMNLLGKALMQIREEIRQHVLAGEDLSSLPVDRAAEAESPVQELSYPSETASSSEDEHTSSL